MCNLPGRWTRGRARVGGSGHWGNRSQQTTVGGARFAGGAIGCYRDGRPWWAQGNAVPLLDQTVIERTPGAVTRLATIEAELLRATGLQPGQCVGPWHITGWQHEGAHLRIEVIRDGKTLAVLAGPRDDQDGAFLRTAHWNLAYRDGHYDDTVAQLLAAIGVALDRAPAQLQLDNAALRQRWFSRPGKGDVLEVSPGKKLYVRVTDHCDEACVFCNATEGNANIIESKSAVAAVLKGLPAGALSQVIFSGGEPTLVKSLPEMVGLAYDRGARQIIIQTNGVAFAQPDALQPYLPYKDRLGIGFSLHATDAQLSAEMLDHRDLARFPAKIRAIDEAVRLGFHVKITCVVMRPNLAQVPQFAQWVWDRWGTGVHRLQFSYAMPRGNAWLNQHLLLRFSECIGPFGQAFAIGRQTGMRVETSQSCCVPPCVMPEFVNHYDIYGDFAGKTSDPERVKPPEICGTCKWDRICAGVWQRYLDVYGGDELKAVQLPEPPTSIEDFLEPEVLDLSAC